MRRAMLLLVAFALAACGGGNETLCPPVTRPSNLPSATATSAPSAAPSAAACVATDQDKYVYNPQRLTVLAACMRATGTIAAIRKEADGDDHILVKLDPAYAGLVNAANSGIELGDLVVEPVCELPVTQADAVATCAGDHDPTNVTGLIVGLHVWMEGRYVTDGAHGGWAEFHPLYRWGLQTGLGVALPSETPPPIDDEAP